jgi:hypothetical protein
VIRRTAPRSFAGARSRGARSGVLVPQALGLGLSSADRPQH